MTATFSCEDLGQLTGIVAEAWRSASGLDWSVPAGTLDWSCVRTADHAVDTLLAPAFFLASRRQDDYPDGGWSPGEHASPAKLIEGLEISARILAGVVTAAEPGTRAIIWRHPRVETRGPEDFIPRGALELVLHAHDVCLGLGVPFSPPNALCDRLRQHTRSWPHWRLGGWIPLSMSGNPWSDLLRASGRQP